MGFPMQCRSAPKKIIDPETVLISDQFFGKTLTNMKANPQAALTFWKGREGYQLKGSITIEVSGPPVRGNVPLDCGGAEEKGFSHGVQRGCAAAC